MLDRYIQIKDRQIICGQTSSGVWYCKELPCENTNEVKQLIGELNNIFNEYNKQNGKERKATPKKETKTLDVKGLQ